MPIVEPYWEEQHTDFQIDFCNEEGWIGWLRYAIIEDMSQEKAEEALRELREQNRVENPKVKFRLAKVTRSVYHEGF